jgi:hypothetical protein
VWSFKVLPLEVTFSRDDSAVYGRCQCGINRKHSTDWRSSVNECWRHVSKSPSWHVAAFFFQHDNARLHTNDCSDSPTGFTVLDHSYSPDLAPLDFHLYPKLKEHLRGYNFLSDDEGEAAVNMSSVNKMHNCNMTDSWKFLKADDSVWTAEMSCGVKSNLIIFSCICVFRVSVRMRWQFSQRMPDDSTYSKATAP